MPRDLQLEVLPAMYYITQKQNQAPVCLPNIRQAVAYLLSMTAHLTAVT